MLDIETFDARRGGNVLYKALSHPLAVEALAAVAWRAPLAVFDPEGVAAALWALQPGLPAPDFYCVQDVDRLGARLGGVAARPVTELAASGAAMLLVAGFDARRAAARFEGVMPVVTLDAARIPAAMLTNPRTYLDRLNFATNFAFFRDENNLHTRVVGANYWAGYGAGAVRLWLRLFGAAGGVLATWEEALGPAGFAIDSRDVRARFGLPPFTGQLFLHTIGVAGHDVVKYAVDTYGSDGEPSLSVTHDANAWPSDRYAGLPAPRADETVRVWIQNSHAAPIPAGAVALDRMGAARPVALEREVPGFATVAVDTRSLLPDVTWPAQFELRTGRHMVRPRYEVVRAGRTRIAHVNVERGDLRPEPAIRSLSNLLGRGFLLPFPVLPPERFRTIVQPNPMAESQATLPVRLDLFDAAGRPAGERFLGCLPRDHGVALALDGLAAAAGHAELVYDFREGGEADGWLHALFRYENRESGHAAECSFGAHIFNTAMTWREEPQSYSGPPPGLTTRLFLKLGREGARSFAVLIYPASADWHAFSTTMLQLVGSDGAVLAEEALRIACRGSAMVFPDEVFGAAALARAGEDGYVLVRDGTCRLFGYHGVMRGEAFSLDHMFGF